MRAIHSQALLGRLATNTVDLMGPLDLTGADWFQSARRSGIPTDWKSGSYRAGPA